MPPCTSKLQNRKKIMFDVDNETANVSLYVTKKPTL